MCVGPNFIGNVVSWSYNSSFNKGFAKPPLPIHLNCGIGLLPEIPLYS